MNSRRLKEYIGLLEIRRTAGRRDLSILGGIFIVAFMGLVAFGLLDRLNGRSLLIVSSLVAVFGFVALMTWVRLEIVKGTIELVQVLQEDSREEYNRHLDREN